MNKGCLATLIVFLVLVGVVSIEYVIFSGIIWIILYCFSATHLFSWWTSLGIFLILWVIRVQFKGSVNIND